MDDFIGTVRRGAIAGAAGTTALNAVTYLDMAVRGRPSSSTPEQTVERAAGMIGLDVPGDETSRESRLTGLGSLLGMAAGVGAGVAVAALRDLGWPRGTAPTLGAAWIIVMLAGNGPMTALGVTDPRTWSTSSWIADIVPHAAYAATATATLRALDA